MHSSELVDFSVAEKEERHLIQLYTNNSQFRLTLRNAKSICDAFPVFFPTANRGLVKKRLSEFIFSSIIDFQSTNLVNYSLEMSSERKKKEKRREKLFPVTKFSKTINLHFKGNNEIVHWEFVFAQKITNLLHCLSVCYFFSVPAPVINIHYYEF